MSNLGERVENGVHVGDNMGDLLQGISDAAGHPVTVHDLKNTTQEPKGRVEVVIKPGESSPELPTNSSLS